MHRLLSACCTPAVIGRGVSAHRVRAGRHAVCQTLIVILTRMALVLSATLVAQGGDRKGQTQELPTLCSRESCLADGALTLTMLSRHDGLGESRREGLPNRFAPPHLEAT